MPKVHDLAAKVRHLADQGLTGVGVAANWLRRRVIPLKQQVHPAWEYSGPTDPTRERSEEISESTLERYLREMFQDYSSWVMPKSVTVYDLSVPCPQVSYLIVFLNSIFVFRRILMFIVYFFAGNDSILV